MLFTSVSRSEVRTSTPSPRDRKHIHLQPAEGARPRLAFIPTPSCCHFFPSPLLYKALILRAPVALLTRLHGNASLRRPLRSRYLRCLQVLQGEVPQLGGRVQQQELEPSRGDVRRLSRLAARANAEEEECEALLLGCFSRLWRSKRECSESKRGWYLFMRPASTSSWARSWLTAAQGEPTMKCRMTSQRSVA